ncbi:4-hydroxy-tetrahydrodipicolinate reductase [Macrococcoides bohemicum]|uniref:4-hydroxy-tetrahydrodipicolinate reductase n=1 Tax=Macrococcoides bohemicum TaxID=1903056 RepID=A0AAJ4TVG1_9STAP|nr:4-hydroxy-tetrahydrodipicolinate reductase [Macrococcus bohemicus]QYA41350.1 4-hydroxy-tetrahydrodipicolinate reductase [Macrococcus bohemicus]
MKILLAGFGAMNERVAKLALDKGHEITGIILSRTTERQLPYPIYYVDDEFPEADVIIDFSNPEITLPLIQSKHNIPLVIATTGEKEAIIKALKIKAQHTSTFFSANMSYGVHILTELIQYAVPLLKDYDIELIERHHNKKVDGPSGTLVKLLDAIQEKRSLNPVTDRTLEDKERAHDDVGISVVRGGTITGEHEVLFAGIDETIQIIHRAQSKDIFANGAIAVAEQLINKQNGYYTFENLS